MHVRAEKLSMAYHDGDRRVEVFRDLDLEVTSGSTLAIVGESGIGKSTLLSLLGALEIPSGGRVFWGEDCISDMQRGGEDVAPVRGRVLGFVFQSHHLLPEFNAIENAAMPMLIQSVAPEEAFGRAEELLAKVGLGHRLSHRPTELSGGEQQRVAIARALVNRPGIILADEPTGNLDGKTGDEIADLLLSVQEEAGVSLIIVTHSLDLAQKMDRVCELTAKEILERS